ncbi:MAG TPA: hypothetical protein VL752_10550 [Acidisoma sp.]|uniref:hypothetical protein n=1 Tax=Acidisoma sp. TaxID=1872115 RepID=UPI002C7EF99B|nr:hypothetical protein [Acidisoma sp.]HTI01372.1 hypothetical protein [Acidisoma sp.]
MTQTLSSETLKRAAQDFPVTALPVIEQFVLFVGEEVWSARIAEIIGRAAASNRCGAVFKQRHALELAIERMRGRAPDGTRAAERATPTVAEQRLGAILAELVGTTGTLSPVGLERLRAHLAAALSGEGRLVDLLHLFRTAALHRERGFDVFHAGLEEAAPYDLVLRREDAEVECICHTVSAEAGRDIHRLAWASFCDRIEAQMKPWIEARPGRYLLKITFARGLRDQDAAQLDALQARVLAMLDSGARLDQDEAAVFRIEPLVLGGNNAAIDGLMTRLRQEFGPEAHLSLSACADGVWAMAARAGKRNAVAETVRGALDGLAPARVSGTRPAILALFIEDMDRPEWRMLMDSLELEGAARQYMTSDAAAHVVAVTCYSRMEMFGLSGPDAAAEGELRFRNQAHPAAKISALAPAIQSSL